MNLFCHQDIMPYYFVQISVSAERSVPVISYVHERSSSSVTSRHRGCEERPSKNLSFLLYSLSVTRLPYGKMTSLPHQQQEPSLATHFPPLSAAEHEPMRSIFLFQFLADASGEVHDRQGEATNGGRASPNSPRGRGTDPESAPRRSSGRGRGGHDNPTAGTVSFCFADTGTESDNVQYCTCNTPRGHACAMCWQAV